MTFTRPVFVAMLAGALWIAGFTLDAQTPATAGKKSTPPIRGAAEVDFVRLPVRREGSMLVTTIVVRNTSNAPIAGLTIEETWSDRSNKIRHGGKARVTGVLQPGDTQTVEIRTPAEANMGRSLLQFSHANGTVPKPHAVTSSTASSK